MRTITKLFSREFFTHIHLDKAAVCRQFRKSGVAAAFSVHRELMAIIRSRCAFAECLILVMGLFTAPPAVAQTVTTILNPCPYCGMSPINVILDPVTNQILVPGRGANSYVWINGATNSASTGTFPAYATTGGVAVNPRTHKFYVAIPALSEIAVFNTTNGTEEAAITRVNSNYLAVNPVTGTVYSASGTVFSLSSPPPTLSVTQGSDAVYTLNLVSVGGPFSNAVKLGWGSLPTGTTCAFAANSVTPGAIGGSTQMTVTTTASVYAGLTRIPGGRPPAALPALLLALCLPGLFSAVQWRRRWNRRPQLACILLAILLTAGFLISCGGGGFPLRKVGGTPAGAYTITVTGTSGSLQHSTTVTLTVTGS